MGKSLTDDVAECQARLIAYDKANGTDLADTGSAALKRMMRTQLHRKGVSDIRELNRQELVYFFEYLVAKARGGFRKTVKAGLAECTAEAMIVRHRQEFKSHTVTTCANRLRRQGLDELVPNSILDPEDEPTDGVSTLTALFADRIGIPLRNQQWSWGVYDEENHRVILRVWQDEIQESADGEFVRILDETRKYKSNGFPQRKRHIERLRDSAIGFGVVCEPKSKPAGGRSIKSFDESTALRLGEVFEREEKTYATVVGRVELRSLFRTESWQHNITRDIADIDGDKSLDETTRKQLTSARVGQGRFRMAVLEQWGNKCAVTGVTSTEAIRASHVKPWSESDNDERLDPYNGLPLIATMDALFDRLLISFDASGKLLVSPLISSDDRAKMGLDDVDGLTKVPAPESVGYLRWHRNAFERRAKCMS